MTTQMQLAPRRRAEPAAPMAARPVDPNGWDVVSAVLIEDLNKAIAAAGTSPRDFAARPTPDSEVSGGFAPWRIAPDGSGLLINIAVPMTDVAVRHGDQTARLAQATAIVRVELEYIPAGHRMMAGPDGAAQKVETFLLVLRTAPDAARMQADPDHQVAKVMSVTGADALPTRMKSVLKVGLDRWFNDNLAAFQHIFATINVVKSVSEDTDGGFNWMIPSAVSYAFGHNSADPTRSVLAILCQTGGRKADGLVAQAQADLVPPKATAAFCISRQRIAHEMIAKALPLSFDGLSARDLTFAAKDTQVALARPLRLKDVKDEKSGKTYAPMMNRLSVQVNDTEVRMESLTDTEVTAGVHSIVSTIDKFTYSLGKNAKGAKTLKMTRTFHDEHIETRQDKEATIVEWVVRGLALIAGIVAIVATAGTAAVAFGIMVVLSVGVITREAIKKGVSEDGASIDLLITNATQAVTWSTATWFDPVHAELNGGLQIGGIAGTSGLLAGEETPQAAFQRPFAALMATRAAKGLAGGRR